MALSGWFEGEQIARQNNLQQQQMQLEQQKAQASIAMQQAETQQTQQDAQMKRAAYQKEQQLQMMMMQSAMPPQTSPQQGPQGGGQQTKGMPPQQNPESAIDQSISQLQAYEKNAQSVGLYDKAMNASEKIATLEYKKQQISTSQETATYKKMQVQEKTLQDADQLFSGVKNSADWDRVKQMFSQRHPGQKNPFESVSYSPEVVEQIRQGTKQGLEKIKSEREQFTAISEDKNRSSAEGFRSWREKYMEGRAKAQDERAAVRAKSSGKEVSYPSSESLKITREELSKRYPSLPPDELEQYSFDTASRAKAIASRNKGLDQGTALQMALNDPAHMADVKTVDHVYSKILDKLPNFMNPNEHSAHYRPNEKAQAPSAAIEMLKKNPALAPQFQEKYGYLPEGSIEGNGEESDEEEEE